MPLNCDEKEITAPTTPFQDKVMAAMVKAQFNGSASIDAIAFHLDRGGWKRKRLAVFKALWGLRLRLKADYIRSREDQWGVQLWFPL